VREGERGVADREKTSRGHRLFRDEDIFREVPWQRVANSNLDDPSAPLPIALPVIDGWVIDRGLNDISLAGMIAIFQFLPHFHQRHRPLVSKDQWKALEIPAVQLFVVWTLLDQLDE
jgi:hypothetical protein